MLVVGNKVSRQLDDNKQATSTKKLLSAAFYAFPIRVSDFRVRVLGFLVRRKLLASANKYCVLVGLCTFNFGNILGEHIKNIGNMLRAIG